MSVSEEKLLVLALAQLENQKRTIDAEIAELREKLRSAGVSRRGRPPQGKVFIENASAPQPGAAPRSRRRMSEAQRAAISEKLNQRWAERKQLAAGGQNSADPDKMKPRLIKKASAAQIS